jgi:hypothetical protein
MLAVLVFSARDKVTGTCTFDEACVCALGSSAMNTAHLKKQLLISGETSNGPQSCFSEETFSRLDLTSIVQTRFHAASHCTLLENTLMTCTRLSKLSRVTSSFASSRAWLMPSLV